MTPEEISDIMEKSVGKLTDNQCRTLVHYMMGYMKRSSDIELARDAFFRQIKAATEGKTLPVWP